MNIAYILPGIPKKVAGGYKVVYEHAYYLKKLGHNVRIIYPIYPYKVSRETERSFYKKIEIFLFNLFNYIFLFNYNPNKSFIHKFEKYYLSKNINIIKNLNMIQIPRLESKYLPKDLDIIIATWWETAYFVHNIKQHDLKKFYLCQHYETWGGKTSLVKQSYKFDDLNLLAVSNWVKDKIKNEVGRESTVILNSINFSIFKPQRLINYSYNNLRLGYIFTGKNNFKGFSRFIKLYDCLKKDNDIEFHIASYSNCRKESGIDAIYYKTNSAQKMSSFYNGIDILLLMSDSEGFGLPIIESMACGTPVISTPVGVSKNIIKNKHNSFLMETFLYKEAIEKIYFYKSLSIKNKISIRKRAIEDASKIKWTSQIRKLESIFNKTIIN